MIKKGDTHLQPILLGNKYKPAIVVAVINEEDFAEGQRADLMFTLWGKWCTAQMDPTHDVSTYHDIL
jgi:hypothetical protein